MNIFYLDENPQLCAQYHTDKHVVKMILESAQLLCTAVNYHAGEQVTPYKSTHVNHPCSIWVRSSLANWMYLFGLMVRLEGEWRFRFKHTKEHKSVLDLRIADITILAYRNFPAIIKAEPFTSPALAMPEQYRTNNPVESYRAYYNNDKRHLHKWTNRETPFWITMENTNEQ